MHLTKTKGFNINNTLGHYIPEIVKNTPYQHTVIREMLAHQAGFVSWIPFYQKTLINGKPDPKYYAKDSSQTHSIKVSKNLYIKAEYKDSIFSRITHTSLRKKRYKYSDLGYYFLKAVIEKESKMTLDQYVQRYFYKPLGLHNITYHPLYRISKNRILPTENDTIFRNSLIQGDVHDPGAAMLGGVGGHAGVFSNALDLGVLMYTLINNGKYGGQQILSPEVIADFTKMSIPLNKSPWCRI